ncbi:MAG: radical SAM protein [Spirochaetaceae bacterium]|nr:radical SAM protein [Spirochaetaceae bacterium]MDT8297646.1 radical SAM protein [Spirochaetaceae bacterium]
MKILFLNQHTGTRTMPMASACLASALESRFGDEVDCPIMELGPGFPIESTARKAAELQPDLIALTLYVWSREDLLSLAAALPAAYGSGLVPPVIVGGPEVTADPSTIQNHPAVDMAVIGEGEGAVVALVTKIFSSPSIPTADVLASFPAPYTLQPTVDLDDLANPWKAKSIVHQRYEDVVWELTRGCPFACHFCFESKGSGIVRHKSLKRAAEELRCITERGEENIFILDPTFNASPDRAASLLQLFLNNAPSLHYHMEIRTEFLDEEQAALFAELGCTVQIGLQTSREDVGEKIGRPYSPEKFMEKVHLLHSEGVTYGFDLIYGLPDDTLEGFLESLDFALSCAPNHIDIFPLSVLPGTRLRDDASERGINYLTTVPYTVLGSTDFPEESLASASNWTAAAHEFYNGFRAVPWFLTLCSSLDLRPVELIEAWRDEPSPADLGRFIRNLAASLDKADIGAVLADVAQLFTLESASRENLPLPASMELTFDPAELTAHLEMGISDPEELLAFVSRAPGTYPADELIRRWL